MKYANNVTVYPQLLRFRLAHNQQEEAAPAAKAAPAKKAAKADSSSEEESSDEEVRFGSRRGMIALVNGRWYTIML